MCQAPALADLICFHANRQKGFSSMNKENSACSSMDVLLQAIRIKHESPSSVDEMLETGSGFKSDVPMQELLDHFAKIGLCMENSMPSEFGMKFGMGNREVYSRLGKIIYDAAQGVRNIDLSDPVFSNFPETTKKYSVDIAEKRRIKNSFEAIVELDNLACASDRKKFKLQKVEVKEAISPSNIRDQIKNKNPVLLNFAPELIMPKELIESRPKVTKETHFALIVGAEIAYGRCYYIIKNSWGDNCFEEKVFEGAPKYRCNRITGAVSVLGNKVESSRGFNAQWIKKN